MNKQKVIKIWETLDSLFKNLFDHNHEISKENIEAIVDISNEIMGVLVFEFQFHYQVIFKNKDKNSFLPPNILEKMYWEPATESLRR